MSDHQADYVTNNKSGPPNVALPGDSQGSFYRISQRLLLQARLAAAVMTLVLISTSSYSQQGTAIPQISTFGGGISADATCLEKVAVNFSTNPRSFRCKFSGAIVLSADSTPGVVRVEPGMPLAKIESALIEKKLGYKKIDATRIRVDNFDLYFTDGVLQEFGQTP